MYPMNLLFGTLKKNHRKKRILFSGVHPTNFIQFAPIYKVLKQDARIEVFLTGMHHGKDRPDELYRPFAIKEKSVIREKKAKRLHFDMYISPDFHLVGSRRTPSVQFFHTTSFRNFSINKEAKKFSHLFLIGPYMKRKFLQSGMFKGEEERFEEIGMPQTDALFDNTDTDSYEKLNLNRSLPIVLYAPVWSSIETFLSDVQRTCQILSSLEVNLLIKMHDKFYYKEVNKINWRQYLNTLLERNTNIRLINDFDIVPYMRISDLLVSDASAVVHQFSILDKPIVCMKIEIDKFKKWWPNLDQAAYSNRAVIEAPAGEALKEAVLEELNSPRSLSRERQAMSREYFYNIGFSASCAVGKIYQLLNLEVA